MKVYKELSKILTTTFLKQLGKLKAENFLYQLSERYSFVEQVISTDDYWHLFDKTYEVLLGNYRCEYIYKTEIYSVIEKKSRNKDWEVLAEVKADESIADLVWLNDNSIAYEIKTEIDNNQRLEQQIHSYSKLFEKTCLVTYEENIKNAIKVIPDYTGIYVLNNQNKLEEVRKPLEYLNNLSHLAMFNTLRKNEYEQIIKKAYGYLPNVPNTMIYDTCLNLFQDIKIKQAHNFMKEELKKRACKNKTHSFNYPKSIKVLIESGNFKKSELDYVKKILV